MSLDIEMDIGFLSKNGIESPLSTILYYMYITKKSREKNISLVIIHKWDKSINRIIYFLNNVKQHFKISFHSFIERIESPKFVGLDHRGIIYFFKK